MKAWMWARSAAMRSAARDLLHGALGADADELVEAAGRQGDLAAVQMRDRLHRAVQQAAVMADDQRRAGEAGQPALQPQGGFQVQVVGGLVQQQQVGGGEQRGGQRDAHAPAAGKFVHRAGLSRFIEAQPGEDGGGAGGCGLGADGDQPLVDFRQAHRVGAFPPRPAAPGVPGRLAAPCPAGWRRRTALPASPWPAGRATENRMLPPSSESSPAMARSRVDLPAPLRPTRPMRRPGSTVRSAPSSRVRPPRRMVAPEMTRRDMRRLIGRAAGRGQGQTSAPAAIHSAWRWIDDHTQYAYRKGRRVAGLFASFRSEGR